MMRHLLVTDSDMIEAIGFDLLPGKVIGPLEVVFKSTPDVVYRYEDVSLATFLNLVISKSIGEEFHKNFKKKKVPFTKSARSPDLKK